MGLRLEILSPSRTVLQANCQWVQLPGELGESGIAVLRAVKRALDPGSLLNPGALLPEEDVS